MKKRNCVSALFLGIALLFSTLAQPARGHGDQFPFVLDDNGAPHDFDLTDKHQKDSRHGGILTPLGEVRALIVFAGFTNDGMQGSHSGWPYETFPGSNDLTPLPNWKGDLAYNNFSEFGLANADFTLSNYFYQMSRGQLKLVAEYFPKRINVTATTALNSNWNNYNRLVWENLNTDPDFNNYDFSSIDRRESRPSFQFDNHRPPHDQPDQKVDYVMIVWRYDGTEPAGTTGLGEAVGSGGGFAYVPSFTFANGIKVGDGFTITTGLRHHPDGIRGLFIHEFSHQLHNGPHFYSANGVVGRYLYTGFGWSMTSNGIRPINSANGWERWFLGWVDPITVHGPGDLPSDGTFQLRDFIETGDAIRIELPFPASSGQYLWLENHQGKSNFDDRDGFNTNGVGNPLPAPPRGLMAYTERVSDDYSNVNIFGSGANGLQVLHPGGDFDWQIPSQPISPNPEEWWRNTIYDVSKDQENPISGQNETSALRWDFDGDGKISHDIGGNGASNEQEEVVVEGGSSPMEC